MNVDLLVNCRDGDFMVDEEAKKELRKQLRQFRDRLATDATPDLGTYRNLMEGIVFFVVKDAVGVSVASFDDALGRIRGLKGYLIGAKNKPGEGFLRSVQWGIEGFKVFKNMETHYQAGDDLANYVPLVMCAKQNWSALALVLMESIVCCLEWLHRTLRVSLHNGARLAPATSARQPVAAAKPLTTAPLSYTGPPPATTTASRPLAEPPLPAPAVAALGPHLAAAAQITVTRVAELQQTANDVIQELRKRKSLNLLPRYYLRCSRGSQCATPGCNYAHSAEDMHIAGVARAVALGGRWKSTKCAHQSNCRYDARCDNQHESDDRDAILRLQNVAREIVRTTYVRLGELYVEFLSGETVAVVCRVREG
ncbi:hypothetical protein SPRG_13125 [Saprolegnia parasitica CBS 223.65]|uniref:Uncharacterized protein n=1 Tax=Saprolegnia parasitica (strain CBS 223.65) TaxID=695850 RepID=A0A067BTS4_SAPPC|nr:hypothetical protein SPRG_13125 [Saprolegnia parasitica CBS 223.65]KDO21944.1 hypothetical protein SPRG_13125 [Saprolegnia parasitica CBS 223.65]|eukprot:XP_012207384.1 hypothetical protein SPRG_13125 [Saprolegnia parasitica CBS 223.65]